MRLPKSKFSLYLLSLLLILSACGGSANAPAVPPSGTAASAAGGASSYSDTQLNATAENAAGAVLDTAASLAGNPTAQPAKILRSGQVQLLSDQFDQAVGRLRGIAAAQGGYIESSALNGAEGQNRSYNVVFRVPAENFDAAKAQAEACGKVMNFSENAQDASASYYDTARRLQTKQVEEARVLDLISQAQKVEDLVNLENQLADIRTNVEQYTAAMESIDKLAAYSSLTVSLTETNAQGMLPPAVSTGQKIGAVFAASLKGTERFLQGFAVVLATVSVPLLLLAVLAAVGRIGYVLVRKMHRKAATYSKGDKERAG